MPPDALLEPPVEDVLPSPDNTRPVEQDDDLRALGTSMLTHGQQQPATVYANPPAPDGRRTYTVRTGHRRWIAAKLVGMTTLKVIVVAQPQTGGQRHLSRLAENKARKGLTPSQDVLAVAKAKRENPDLSNREIADFTGYLEPEVSKCLAVAACPEACEALADGRLKGISDAYSVAVAPAERRGGLIALRAGGASRDALLAAAKAKPEADPDDADPPKKKARVGIPLPKAKAAVSVTADVATLDGVLAVLLDAADAVRKSIRDGVSLATAKRAWADKAKANGV